MGLGCGFAMLAPTSHGTTSQHCQHLHCKACGSTTKPVVPGGLDKYYRLLVLFLLGSRHRHEVDGPSAPRCHLSVAARKLFQPQAESLPVLRPIEFMPACDLHTIRVCVDAYVCAGGARPVPPHHQGCRLWPQQARRITHLHTSGEEP